MVNGARLFGPSIAGIVIDLVGEAICFLLNGVSFLFVIAALLAMKIVPRPARASHGSVAGGLREGFVYAFGFAPVRAILLLVAMTGLVGMPYIVLLPIFAGDILHGDARTFGFLAGASGVGAFREVCISRRAARSWTGTVDRGIGGDLRAGADRVFVLATHLPVDDHSVRGRVFDHRPTRIV